MKRGKRVDAYLPAPYFPASHLASPCRCKAPILCTTLSGSVTHVRDGDTIEVGKIPIRLNGVSAPELKEPLGPQSKVFMVDLVMGKHVSCELNGDKTHDRFVGTCYLGGRDIGAAVIKAVLALDCPRLSGSRYKVVEKAATRSRIKLWGYCA